MKKYIANIITWSRAAFSFLLLFISTSSAWFCILYLFCGISDMIDGTVARKTNAVSSFGSKSDTVADFIFMAICSIKILPMIHLPVCVWIWIGVIAMIKLGNVVFGFVRMRKLIFPHTVLDKITGLLLFLLPMTISFVLPSYTLPIVCTVATFAAIHEVYFIYTENKYDN